MRPNFRVVSALSVCLIALLSLTGCDADDETYSDAVAELAEANAQRDQALRTLRSNEQELSVTREQLQQARQELESARREVVEARQDVISRADDVALFRAIQSKLLQDDTLRDAAIAVVVRNHVATLRGLASERQAVYAEQLAVSQPGVKSVRNEIVLNTSSAGSAPGATK